jgi:hypothetical protein
MTGPRATVTHWKSIMLFFPFWSPPSEPAVAWEIAFRRAAQLWRGQSVAKPTDVCRAHSKFPLTQGFLQQHARSCQQGIDRPAGRARPRPPCRVAQALFVAQICNLLYRRIAFGGPSERSHAWKFRQAGAVQLSKPAQDRSPRHSEREFDATLPPSEIARVWVRQQPQRG